MEACPGAHFLARVLKAQGHEIKLMPAEYVRPFVKSNKNDYVDAEAIAEAVQRPTMRFVPIKSEAQLDLQALHRVRDRWMGRRTGPLISTALTAAIGNGLAFHKSRDLAAWLDLVPRQHSTGGGSRLLGISKRFFRTNYRRLGLCRRKYSLTW
jgi:transposase